MRCILLFIIAVVSMSAHDGHGKKNAPASANALESPLGPAQAKPELGKPLYEKSCAACHGADGQAKTPQAAERKPAPANLADHRMDSMADGEIFWVVTNGIAQSMPAYKAQLSDTERWQIVLYVRQLCSKEHD